MNLERVLSEKSHTIVPPRPEIFDLKKSEDRANVSRLLGNHAIQRVVDEYEEQKREYFAIQNPGLAHAPQFENAFHEYFHGLEQKTPLWQRGRWVYFPWLSTLAHILEEEKFYLVRTARNRELVTRQEQEILYNAVIGIAGLSIGNSVALAVALEGGGKHIKLADCDSLALSNLNRIRSGVEHLGLKKVEMTARQVYALNPYANVDMFCEGLTKENIERFFAGPPRIDIIVDEIDSIAVKYLIRRYAKKYRIPLVMAADNADSAVIDIERYDHKPQPQFFHGRIGKASYEELSRMDKFAIGKTIAKHIGKENITERMRKSLSEMGKTIVSWPQLGSTALVNGSAIAYCIRKILTNQPLIDNRAIISFDELFDPNNSSKH